MQTILVIDGVVEHSSLTISMGLFVPTPSVNSISTQNPEATPQGNQFAPPRFQDLSKFRVPHGFRGRSGLVVLLWQIVQDTLFAWSPQPAYFWRRWLLRLFGAEVGAGVLIRPTARVTYPWKVKFSKFCWIGDYAEIYSLGNISIGAHSVVSQRSYLCAGTHDYRDPTFPLVAGAITIGDEVWIAADSFIAPGTMIGHAAIVGARSTVLTDVEPGTIVAGSPATLKGIRQLRDGTIA